MAELLAAVKKGNAIEVERIMTHANVNANISGRTPLGLACQHGHLEITKILLNGGADIAGQEYHYMWTPLHVACERGTSEQNLTEIVELLVQQGANVNAYDVDGATPLHVAASQGLPEIVKILLRAGADPNQPAMRYRRLPIHDAALAGSVNVIDVLLEVGVEVDVRDSVQETSLFLAIEFGNDEVCSALLDWGADAFLKDSGGLNAYDNAMTSRNESTIDLLEQHAVKMKIAKLLSDQDSHRSPLVRIQSDKEKDFERQCTAEISSLKNTLVGNTKFSYYDLLKQKCAALRHPNLKELLSQDNHRQCFPVYGRVIDRQLKLGLERLELLHKCGSMLRCGGYLSEHLPPELIELICTYLDNDTLQAVIQSNYIRPKTVPTGESPDSHVSATDRLAAGLDFLQSGFKNLLPS